LQRLAALAAGHHDRMSDGTDPYWGLHVGYRSEGEVHPPDEYDANVRALRSTVLEVLADNPGATGGGASGV